VLKLDALLCLLDRAGDERMRQNLSFLSAHPIHQLGDPVRPEQPHQIVFQSEEELRCTGSP
jgi:hypothetical protein